MSANVGTLPLSPEPAPELLEPALRAVLGIINNSRDVRRDPPPGSERCVFYAMVRDNLERIGHTRDVAEWAIHAHAVAGRVVVEPLPELTPLSWSSPSEDCQFIPGHALESYALRPTPALRDWVAAHARAAPGSPLAALRSEQDVLHALARRRAEQERTRLDELARREAFYLRWAEATDCAQRIDADATANGWDGEQKTTEYVTRLLQLGAIVRGWDAYWQEWAASPRNRYGEKPNRWADQLRHAAGPVDAPIELRFAAGLTMLAEQDDRATLTEEVRQLVRKRDLKPVSAWFPWLWDQIIPATFGPELAGGGHPYAPVPLHAREDENRARIALGLEPRGDYLANFASSAETSPSNSEANAPTGEHLEPESAATEPEGAVTPDPTDTSAPETVGDVHLTLGAIVNAQAMLAHLDTLAGSNTTVRAFLTETAAKHAGQALPAIDDAIREAAPNTEALCAFERVAPDWNALGDAKQAILKALLAAKERMQGEQLARKAGYKHGTVRHHVGELQTWNFIDRTKDGYAITALGAALVPESL